MRDGFDSMGNRGDAGGRSVVSLHPRRCACGEQCAAPALVEGSGPLCTRCAAEERDHGRRVTHQRAA